MAVYGIVAFLIFGLATTLPLAGNIVSFTLIVLCPISPGTAVGPASS
jgi:hypothetical protein